MNEKNNSPKQPSKYFETIISSKKTAGDNFLQNISWYEEPMIFDTLREADEWIGSEAYNKIGYEYDGYITLDAKLAYSLVYQLIRNNKFGESTKVYTDECYVNDINYYYVWINKDNSQG